MIAHPNVSQFSGTRGCRTSAAPAIPVATIGATRATTSAISMIGPIPGMTRISSGEKRIIRNISQIAAQIARQDIAAVRKDVFAILILVLMPYAVHDRSPGTGFGRSETDD
jgi:hypothetical protein